MKKSPDNSLTKISAEQLRLIVENANEAILVLQNNALVYFNPKTVEIIGCSAEKLKNTPFTEFIHPDDKPLVMEHFKKHLEGKDAPSIYSFRLIKNNGEITWIQANTVAIQWNGQPATLSLTTEITLHKLTERILKESEDKYKKIVEIAQDAIVIHSDGVVVYVNPAAVKMFGAKSALDLIGKPAMEFVSPDNRATTMQRTRDLLSGKKIKYPIEDTYLRFNGSPATVEVSSSVLLYNDRPAVQVIIRDISDRKKQLEALENSERKYRELFENLRDGWVSTDMDGHFIECNQAFLGMIGYSALELKEKTFKELTPEKWHDFEKTIIGDTLLKRGYSGIFEKEYIHKNGTVFPVEVSLYLQTDDSGNPVGAWGLTRDITNRKTAKDAVAISEYLYRLTLGNISDTVFVTDDNGNFTFICPNTEVIFGYNKEKVAEMGNVSNLLGGQVIDIKELKTSGEFSNIEYRITDKSGNKHDLLISVKMVAIGKGSVLYTCRDITDRKKIDNLWNLNREILEKVTRGKSLGKVYDDITNRVDELLPDASSSIFLMMPDNKHIHLVSGPRLSNKWKEHVNVFPVSAKAGSCGTAAYTGKRIIVTDITADPRWAQLRDEALAEGFQACWSQPVLSSKDNSVLGTFALYYKYKHKPGDYELQLMENLAKLLSLVLERRRNEEQVLAERERLFQLLDQLPGIVYLLAPDHTIKFANKRFTDEYGPDFTKPCYKLIHDKSRSCKDCPTFDVFKTRIPIKYEYTLSNGKTYLAYDLPFTDTDGSPLVLEYSLDITDRKEIEKELQMSEEQFRLIWENSPLGLRLADANGKIIRVNEAYCKLVKKSRKELEEKPLSIVYQKSNQKHILTSHSKRFNEKTIKTHFETELTLWDGTKIWLNVSNAFFNSEDHPQELLLGIFQDISERKEAEIALYNSEEQLRLIWENSPIGLRLTDSSGNVVMANKIYCNLFAKDINQVIGHPFSLVYKEIPGEQILETYQKRFKNHTIKDTFETELPLWNGQTIWMGTSNTFLAYGSPEQTFVLSTFNDITPRKLIEQDLQNSEKRFMNAEQAAHLGSWEMELATGKSVWSDEFFRICGYEPGSIEPSSEIGFTIIHPDDRERASRAIENSIKTGDPYDIEKRIVHPDGTIRWVHSRGKISYGDQKKPITLVGSFLDITERKIAEEKIINTHRFYEDITENIQDGIWVSDKDDVIYYVNQGMEKIAGVSRDKIIGNNVLADFPDETTNKFNAFYIRAKKTLKPVWYETQVKTPAGRDTWQNGWLIPKIRDTQFDGIICTIRDVTDRLEAVDQLLHSNLLLENAQKIAKIGYWEFDMKSRSVWASDSARRIYGLGDDEWTIENVQQIPLPEYRDTLDNMLLGLIKNDQPYDIEFKIKRKTDGAVLDIHSIAEYDKEKQTVFGVLQDITDRKRAEEHVRESKEKYHSLFNQYSLGIYIHNLKGQIIDVNPVGCLQLGYTKEKLLKLTIFDFLPQNAETVNLPKDEILRMWKNWSPGTRETVIAEHQRKDGSIFPVEITTGPLIYGEEQYILSTVQDITERKQAEEALKEKMSELERFNKVMVGRETRMIELKQEINELCEKLGIPRRYSAPESADR